MTVLAGVPGSPLAGVLAALLAGAAAALLVPWASPLPEPSSRPGPDRRLLTGVAAGVTALVLLADGTHLVLGLVVVAAGVGTARLVGRIRDRRVADARRQRVVEVAESLAGELMAGQPPLTALAHSVETWQPMHEVVRAARLGADVPAALRRVADQSGAEGLRDLAAAWRVAESTGSGLALALARVAEAARERESANRIVAAELASAHATARLVAGLPLFVLVLGSGLGGNPWAFLVDSPVGLVCLATGLFLMLAGLSWIERVAASVSR